VHRQILVEYFVFQVLVPRFSRVNAAAIHGAEGLDVVSLSVVWLEYLTRNL